MFNTSSFDKALQVLNLQVETMFSHSPLSKLQLAVICPTDEIISPVVGSLVSDTSKNSRLHYDNAVVSGGVVEFFIDSA